MHPRGSVAQVVQEPEPILGFEFPPQMGDAFRREVGPADGAQPGEHQARHVGRPGHLAQGTTLKLHRAPFAEIKFTGRAVGLVDDLRRHLLGEMEFVGGGGAVRL